MQIHVPSSPSADVLLLDVLLVLLLSLGPGVVGRVVDNEITSSVYMYRTLCWVNIHIKKLIWCGVAFSQKFDALCLKAIRSNLRLLLGFVCKCIRGHLCISNHPTFCFHQSARIFVLLLVRLDPSLSTLLLSYHHSIANPRGTNSIHDWDSFHKLSCSLGCFHICCQHYLGKCMVHACGVQTNILSWSWQVVVCI